MLHSVGPGPEACFATDRAGHSTWTVNLHVHVEFILGVKRSVALVTDIRIAVIIINAIHTPRTARTFAPLVVREVGSNQMVLTFSTSSSHLYAFVFLVDTLNTRQTVRFYDVCAGVEAKKFSSSLR